MKYDDPNLGIPQINKSRFLKPSGRGNYINISYASVYFDDYCHQNFLKVCLHDDDIRQYINNPEFLHRQHFNLYHNKNKLIFSLSDHFRDAYMLQKHSKNKCQFFIPADHLPFSVDTTRGQIDLKIYYSNNIICIEVELPCQIFTRINNLSCQYNIDFVKEHYMSHSESYNKFFNNEICNVDELYKNGFSFINKETNHYDKNKHCFYFVYDEQLKDYYLALDFSKHCEENRFVKKCLENIFV